MESKESVKIRAEIGCKWTGKYDWYSVNIIVNGTGHPNNSFDFTKQEAELIAERINEPNRIVKLIDEMIEEREGTPEYIGKTKNALESLKSRIEGGKEK